MVSFGPMQGGPSFGLSLGVDTRDANSSKRRFWYWNELYFSW